MSTSQGGTQAVTDKQSHTGREEETYRHSDTQTLLNNYDKAIKMVCEMHVCVWKAKIVCCTFREDTGFPWGDSAVLWAWASYPVTMDHCLTLSEDENMCMLVQFFLSVCVCVFFFFFAYFTKYSKNWHTEERGRQWSVSFWEWGWGWGAQIHINKQTHA